MRIVVFSDTHRNISGCIQLLENMQGQIDAVLHAGDIAEDIEKLKSTFPHMAICGVRGNNDFYTNLPTELLLDYEGIKIFLTHGHRYKVKYTYEDIADVAIAKGAQIAVFGHTHQSCDRIEKGVHLLNPGSAGGLWPTYAIIEMENGKISTDIISLR